MKKQDINIRIESETQDGFKKLCDLEKTTLSEKLIKFIEKEVNSKNSIKLTLIRNILEKYMSDFLFLSLDEGKNKITEILKNYLSFDFKMTEITDNNGIQFFQIFVIDGDKTFSLNCNIVHGKIL